MIRIITGVLIELFSVIMIFGMILGRNNDPDPIEVTVTASIILSIFMLIGGLLIYFGIKKYIIRESVLNIALKSYRRNGSIDYAKIQEELKINEVKARKLVLWGYRKNLFFEINQNGINIHKDFEKYN